MPRSRHQAARRAEFVGRDHRAGRVGRAGDDEPGEVAGLGEQFGVGLVMRVLADLDQHRLEAERAEDVAIGGIAGRRQRDPVARLEGGEKGELEGGRRAGGDDDLGRVDGDAVLLAVMPRRSPARSGAMPSASV